MNDADLAAMRTLADYQFGRGAGSGLFPPVESLRIQRSSSGRPRQILSEEGRIVSLRIDGRFTLGIEGGRRLVTTLDPPGYRVTVGDESEPFVREGKNVFNKFVGPVDEAIRQGDEVAVVHERGDLLAVGRAELDAAAMADFETGMAVAVRDSIGSTTG
ncbi:MAG: PUA domain-containing protein [Halanaeroarchaeum sp.]